MTIRNSNQTIVTGSQQIIGGFTMKKSIISKIIMISAVFVLFSASSVFAQTYIDPSTGMVSANITEKNETMTVNALPGIGYFVENNTDCTLIVNVDGIPYGVLGPRIPIDPINGIYGTECAAISHDLKTIDTLRYKKNSHVLNITTKITK